MFYQSVTVFSYPKSIIIKITTIAKTYSVHTPSEDAHGASSATVLFDQYLMYLKIKTKSNFM